MPPAKKPTPRKKRPAALKGSCGCGAVTFTVKGKRGNVVWCHCSRCQRFHGGPGAYLSAPRGAVLFTRREGLTWWEASPRVQRGFCRQCGSSLFFSDASQAQLYIGAGTLTSPTGLKTVLHIHVGSKPDWYQVKDGAPQRKSS